MAIKDLVTCIRRSARRGRAVLALLLFAAAGTVQAATITVNTTNGGGVNINGNCSLSEAIVSSNFNVPIDACASGATGQDTIAFTSGLFSGPPTFSATIFLQQSLDISDGGIIIAPPIGRSLTIRGSGTHRLFTISGGASQFRRLTLSDGSSPDIGGAILINNPSSNTSLLLENVNAETSVANDNGGFIGGFLSQARFDLTVRSSLFSSNISNAIGLIGSLGGGAIGVRVSSIGVFSAVIEDSTFSSNEAANLHGGAIALGSTGGLDSIELNVSGSTFDSNVAGDTGGGVYLEAFLGSGASYSATFRNNRFSDNSADRAGAVFASYSAESGTPSSSLLIARNSFVSNSALDGAGAVDIVYVDSVVRNNLFAHNAVIPGVVDAGALRIDHDGFGSTVTDAGSQVIANTFFENSGGPNDLLLDMPLIAQGAAGPSRFDANVVVGLTNDFANCVINNSPPGDFNASNIASGCTVGAGSVEGTGLDVALESVSDPVHAQAAIPSRSSPAVDLWPEFACTETLGGAPLVNDLLGERRDSSTGLPPDGDGDLVADCDAGSVEVAEVFPLGVTLAGGGAGSVSSSPGGVNCPDDCSENYLDGTAVELFAFPVSGSEFDGWSGDCSGTSSCTILMDQVRSVTATFVSTAVSFPVRVEIDGNAIGMVMSTPAGIDCPGDCKADFEQGQTIVLTPIAGGSAEFLGWAADCAAVGTGSCELTIDQAYRAIAIFGDGDLMFLDGFE